MKKIILVVLALTALAAGCASATHTPRPIPTVEHPQAGRYRGVCVTVDGFTRDTEQSYYIGLHMELYQATEVIFDVGCPAPARPALSPATRTHAVATTWSAQIFAELTHPSCWPEVIRIDLWSVWAEFRYDLPEFVKCRVLHGNCMGTEHLEGQAGN